MLGPGSPFRLLFRTLKPVLFVQVMPVGWRSVRLSVRNSLNSPAGRGRRRASPFPPWERQLSVLSSRTFSTHRQSDVDPVDPASSLRIPTVFERLTAKACAGTGSRGLRTGGGRASLSPETVDYNCITMCNRGSVNPLVPKPLVYLA